MKNQITLFILFMSFTVCYGQETKLVYNSNIKQKPQTFSFRPGTGVRVYDGFLLPSNIRNPSNLELNNIMRLADSIQLTEIGMKYQGKALTFMNSNVTDIREYLYIKANIGRYLLTHGFNLPVILDNVLITFEKYKTLDSISKQDIIKIHFSRTAPIHLSDYDTPLGVIIVTTRLGKLK